DLSLPENQRKLEAVDALAQLAQDAGLTLVQLALAWVINHRAVTAAITGPRTIEQFQDVIEGWGVVLEDVLLDRIDQIVPPGTNFSFADAGPLPPSLENARLRRRRASNAPA